MKGREFIWGTATSSYQIEGAIREGGRGDSIWDIFCREPGRILDGSDGSVACDHYHRFHEDIKLIADLGCSGYRFSLAWPRIIPEGSGKVNPDGLAFYNRLIDGLLEHGITPFVTLFHWDLPAACRYGWLNRDTAKAFGEYAKVCFDAFGDRVRNWMTLNEPWCSAMLGYGQNVFAPGLQDPHLPYVAAHNLLLAHGFAAREFRDGGYAGEIGIVNNSDWREPLTQDPQDAEASDRALQFSFGWYTDPLFTGEYPEAMRTRLGKRLPEFTSEEKKILIGSSDFLGLNHYTSSYVSAFPPEDAAGSAVGNGGFSDDQEVYFIPIPNCSKTDMGWDIVPWGLRRMLNWIARRYQNPPLYVTENGCAAPEPDEASAKNDTMRQMYLRDYIAEALKARDADHVNLRGYFCWSLLDNFEWTSGYLRHFGLVRCTPEKLERIPKGAYYTYREIIREDSGKSRLAN